MNKKIITVVSTLMLGTLTLSGCASHNAKNISKAKTEQVDLTAKKEFVASFRNLTSGKYNSSQTQISIPKIDVQAGKGKPVKAPFKLKDLSIDCESVLDLNSKNTSSKLKFNLSGHSFVGDAYTNANQSQVLVSADTFLGGFKTGANIVEEMLRKDQNQSYSNRLTAQIKKLISEIEPKVAGKYIDFSQVSKIFGSLGVTGDKTADSAKLVQEFKKLNSDLIVKKVINKMDSSSFKKEDSKLVCTLEGRKLASVSQDLLKAIQDLFNNSKTGKKIPTVKLADLQKNLKGVKLVYKINPKTHQIEMNFAVKNNTAFAGEKLTADLQVKMSYAQKKNATVNMPNAGQILTSEELTGIIQQLMGFGDQVAPDQVPESDQNDSKEDPKKESADNEQNPDLDFTDEDYDDAE